MNHACHCFPAEAGPHLSTPEGWKAELAWVAGYMSGRAPAGFFPGVGKFIAKFFSGGALFSSKSW